MKVITLALLPAVVLAVAFDHSNLGTTNISTVVITPRSTVHRAMFERNDLGKYSIIFCLIRDRSDFRSDRN